MVKSKAPWLRVKAARRMGKARAPREPRAIPAALALLPATAISLTLVTAAAFATVAAPPPSGAPDWTLRCADGTTVRFGEALARGPVLLAFWALWSGPCLKELPHLDALARETAGRLTVLAVNQDGPRSVAKVRPYLQARGLSLRVPLDTAGEVSRQMQVGGVIPLLLLYDAQGREIFRHAGYHEGDEQRVRRRVRELLASEGADEGGRPGRAAPADSVRGKAAGSSGDAAGGNGGLPGGKQRR